MLQTAAIPPTDTGHAALLERLAKRSELADLRGRVALLTGGRVKIGYQAGLRLLRSGAHLISYGIHMNSVDTGWVTDEDAVEIAERKSAEQRFHPPLDRLVGTLDT